MDATAIRTTCPRDCYDACGMLVKLSADGRINVVGDPEHSVSFGGRYAANVRFVTTGFGAMRACA